MVERELPKLAFFPKKHTLAKKLAKMAINLRTWPRVRWQKSLGIWVVDARRMEKGKMTGKRESFTSEDLAYGRQKALRHEMQRSGTEIKLPTTSEEERLRPYGKTVEDAVTWYIQHIEKQQKRVVLLKDAITDFLGGKAKLVEQEEYSATSYRTASYRLDLLATAFAGATVSSITPALFEDWLIHAGYSKRTMSGIKSIASEFFKWCMKPGRDMITMNPCQFLKIKHDSSEAEILTPEQCEGLLKVCASSPFKKQVIPYVLLSLFAGLRPSECEDLLWEQIDFKEQEIIVISRKLRGEKRHFNMESGLAEKLLPYKGEGLIIQPNWEKNWQATRRFAGWQKFPKDCLRHSFASYWLRIHNNRPRLAEIMGNSEEVIKRHYRQSIPKATADEFWAVLTRFRDSQPATAAPRKRTQRSPLRDRPDSGFSSQKPPICPTPLVLHSSSSLQR